MAATLTEFYLSMSAGVHEARMVITDIVSVKLPALFAFVMLHSSEFLYGSVLAFFVGLSVFALLKYDKWHFKALCTSNRVRRLLENQEWLEGRLAEWRDAHHRVVDAASNKLAEKDATIEELVREVGGLTDSLEAAKGNAKSWFEKWDSTDDDLIEARESIEELEDQVSDLESENSNLNTQLNEVMDERDRFRNLADNYRKLKALNDEVFDQAA